MKNDKKIKKPYLLGLALLALPGCAFLEGLIGKGGDPAASKPSTDQKVTYTLTSSDGLQVEANLTIKAASSPAK